MAKIVLITDTHFGVKSGCQDFLDNSRLFYENIFFPFLRNSQFDHIIHLGDVFHDRRKIDTNVAKNAREMFFTPLHEILVTEKKKMDIICGNHDIYYRDSLETNTLEEFITNQMYSDPSVEDNYENFEIHQPFNIIKTPQKVQLPYDYGYGHYGSNILCIPWITKNNREEAYDKIQYSDVDYLFGHLELNGFNFSKIQVSTHGDDPKKFSKFKRVFSGHYHYRHNKDNIYYLGSPTQQTWIDCGNSNGFHVLDTDTDELEFIENPYHMFEMINFGDDITKSNPKFYRVITGEEDQSSIDNFVKKLYDNNALGVEIISKKDKVDTKEISTQTLETIEDTPTFIRNFVKEDEVADTLINLYNKAVNL